MEEMRSNSMRDLETKLRIEFDRIRADIVASLHRADDPATLTLANHILDGGDWTEADVLNDTDIELLHQKLNRLTELETALARVREGTYGWCRDCGDMIPLARMEAQITSDRCLLCRQKLERQQGIAHGNSL